MDQNFILLNFYTVRISAILNANSKLILEWLIIHIDTQKELEISKFSQWNPAKKWSMTLYPISYECENHLLRSEYVFALFGKKFDRQSSAKSILLSAWGLIKSKFCASLVHPLSSYGRREIIKLYNKFLYFHFLW